MRFVSKFARTFEKRRRVPKWIKFLAFGLILWLFLIGFALVYIGEDKGVRRK